MCHKLEYKILRPVLWTYGHGTLPKFVITGEIGWIPTKHFPGKRGGVMLTVPCQDQNNRVPWLPFSMWHFLRVDVAGHSFKCPLRQCVYGWGSLVVALFLATWQIWPILTSTGTTIFAWKILFRCVYRYEDMPICGRGTGATVCVLYVRKYTRVCNYCHRWYRRRLRCRCRKYK